MIEPIDPPVPARRDRRERPTCRATRRRTKWGNSVQTKPEGITRVGFINPDGLPVELDGEKYNELNDFIKEYDLDGLGLSEINLNLKHLPSSLQ